MVKMVKIVISDDGEDGEDVEDGDDCERGQQEVAVETKILLHFESI